MWELYAKKNEGLAIVSNYDKLEKAFVSNQDYSIYFGKVNYIDYSKHKLDDKNIEPCLQKEKF